MKQWATSATCSLCLLFLLPDCRVEEAERPRYAVFFVFLSPEVGKLPLLVVIVLFIVVVLLGLICRSCCTDCPATRLNSAFSYSSQPVRIMTRAGCVPGNHALFLSLSTFLSKPLPLLSKPLPLLSHDLPKIDAAKQFRISNAYMLRVLLPTSSSAGVSTSIGTSSLLISFWTLILI